MDPDYNSPLIYWWGYCNLSIQLYENFNLINVGETGLLGFLYQYAELNSKYWSVTDIWDSFTTF